MRSLVVSLAFVCGCTQSSAGTPDAAPDTPKTVDATPAEPVKPVDTAIHFMDASARLGVFHGNVIGVALIDYDDDGWLDVTLAGPRVRLFRGIGGGNFAPAPTPLLTENEHAPAGLAWADIDGDADLDLFVTGSSGPPALWRNEGDGQLTNVTADSGITSAPGAQGASFADLDGDGDLDLYLCQGSPFFALDNPEPDGVELGELGAPNRVFMNDGAGKFQNMTDAWGLAGSTTGETFMALPLDFDDDADPDLLIVHDWEPDQLFINQGGGKWEDASAQYLTEPYTLIMGLDVADFNGDGRPDIYGTQLGPDSDLLLVQQPDKKLVDQYESLIGAGLDQSRVTKGWGVMFADLDNDADVDLIATSSFHDYSFDTELSGTLTGQLVVLRHDIVGDTHALVDITTAAGEAVNRTMDGWGLATGDVDRDGAIDVLVGIDGAEVPSFSNQQPHPLLLLNDGKDAHKNGWLLIRLRQPDTPNVFAVGAKVTVTVAGRSSTRWVLSGMSFVSQSPYQQHFGLGSASQAASVKITWPDGVVQDAGQLKTGEHTIIRDI